MWPTPVDLTPLSAETVDGAARRVRAIAALQEAETGA